MGKTAVLLLLIHPSLASKTSLDALQKLYFLCFKKTLIMGEVVVKASKSSSPCYLIMFQRVWRQNLSSKSLRLSCTSIKTFSVWEQFETYLGFKVPERWATRLNRVARWHHLAIEHCREKLGPNKRTMCVFGHRDNQILNSPGVCAADSWSHQKPIGRKKKEKIGIQPLVQSI